MASQLPTAVLGRTGLKVTKLGFGAMEIRGPRIWGGRAVTDQESETILNAVLDAGINFIDTANDYGRSEELMGKFIARRRDQYVLATKCGCCVTRRDEHTDDTPHVWTRENLFRGLEESLGRLKTDHIDVMQLHNPTVEQCDQGELVRALEDMRMQGKVRFIACSSTDPHLSTFIDRKVFEVFQIPYSALERGHERSIQKAADAGAGVIVRGGVARGEPGENRTQFLLRFTITHPGMATTIVGTKNPAHLQENLSAAQRGSLKPDIYAEAKRRLDTAKEGGK